LSNHPKASLGFFPTPIETLPNLSKYLGGPQISIKRDDLTGLALGGNKTRKLEYIIGDAIAQGADTVITAGACQSNHCRQTAAAAAKYQLECHLLLGGKEPDRSSGNLLLDKLFGCHIHWAGKHRKGEDVEKVTKQLIAAGKKPYVIPYGGSNELGAIAFCHAMQELSEQSINSPRYSHIVFASSSGGTQAGLMLGERMAEMNSQIVGISIDKDEINQRGLDERILMLANNTASMVSMESNFSEKDIVLNTDYIGDGYGVVGALESEAISIMAKQEGILLDPVYTGRAMGGLIDMIRNNIISSNDNVLFWHTGGTPALFA
jgi:D-cysteine desulfhydrase